MNFALVGAAGFVAPRHMQAIHDTGNRLLAAVDPSDCVGRIDQFFPEAKFFTEIERFDRFIEKLRRGAPGEAVDFVSICSPNYLHDAHVRLALRAKADAICEKPLVISPWNLDVLEEMEQEQQRRVYCVLQLRLLPSLIAMKQELASRDGGPPTDVCLTYITRRGPWYDVSWKGSQEKSGGVAMNIGIHFFDLLLWLFGEATHSEVHLKQSRKMAGLLELERARVRWFLSTDAADLPDHCRQAGQHAFRSMTCDGQEIEFSHGFGDLHTRAYEEVLAGRGIGIQQARPAIQLVHGLNQCEPVAVPQFAHPSLAATQAFAPRRAA